MQPLFAELPPGDIRSAATHELEPHLAWADASAYLDYLDPQTRQPPKHFLVLLRCKVPTPHPGQNLLPQAFAGMDVSVLAGWQDGSSAFLVCHVSPAVLVALASSPPELGVRFEVSLVPLAPRAREAGLDWPHPLRPPHAPRANSSVVIGLVDHGCPFAHAGLRAQDGSTRILSLWDMGRADPMQPSQFGRQFDRAELSGWLTPTGSGSVVDESAVYREQGFAELAGQGSHGAHLLGLLCGAVPSKSLIGAPPSGGLARIFRECGAIAAARAA